MASIVSESLFSSSRNQYQREEAPCHASPRDRFLNMFGPTEKNNFPYRNISSSSGVAASTGQYPPMTLLSSPSPDYGTPSGSFNSPSGELVRWNVVKDTDKQRGFRMFDGVMVSVKDVSSEELFLERMRIAYSAYDAYVAGMVNNSPLDITKALVRAVSACITKYFTTQSMLRTNRPFIAKILNLECSDMFCTYSDFMRSYLFTNATPDDEAIIELAEKVYAENDFDVCDDFRGSGNTIIGRRTGADDTGATMNTEDHLFDLGMRIAERNVIGGTNASLASTTNSSDYGTAISNALPFHQNSKSDVTNTAMLIMVTDFDALHNYVAYMLYLTPSLLSKRYNVNFDCSRRPPSSSANNSDCCRAREAKKRKKDEAKVVIRDVIEKKRREKIDLMSERREACEATLQQRVLQTTRRNHDLLSNLLLLLFDKSLSGIIDKGFENLNARRGYAVNSAKEIGAATIYTGIIDTVGDVSANIEGYTFENMMKKANADVEKESDQMKDTRISFSLPINTIAMDVNGSKRRRGGTTEESGGEPDE